ncbi:MAG: PHP domain-containing protein [Clostridiaceae bacterium]
MFDSHVHSKFSEDSKENIINIIKNPKKSGVVITDHMDINVSPRFVFDVAEFYKEYIKYRNDRLLLGIEIGLTKETEEEARAICERAPYDYILGAVHFVDGYDLYYPDIYKTYKREELYRLYLETILYSINKNPYIDALAHIDYICRYSIFEDKEIRYSEYKDLIDEILDSLLENNIILELNTRRLNEKEAYNSLKQIFERYKELGGNYVTIGSDAHSSDLIGNNFSSAEEILHDLNLKPCHFKNRKIVY